MDEELKLEDTLPYPIAHPEEFEPYDFNKDERRIPKANVTKEGLQYIYRFEVESEDEFVVDNPEELFTLLEQVRNEGTKDKDVDLLVIDTYTKFVAGVEDGKTQHEEGDGKGDDHVELEQALNGHRSQNKAQKGRARVPHKDLGGVEVIGQKARTGTGQGRHEDGHLGLGHNEGDDQQGGGADGGHAAGQTVQAVDEVDGVGDAHDPEHREGDGQPSQLPVGLAGENVGVGEELHTVA